MGMMKNYVLKLLEQCSEEQFGQDAIEWAIGTGLVHLSYDLGKDVQAIMPKYDQIIEAYRRSGLDKTDEPRNVRAPMSRAVPRSRVKSNVSENSVKRKSAA